MRSLATVTRLAPRSGSYDDGLSAYRTGRFETAIAELSRNADVRSQLLLARTYIRVGRIEDGLSAVWGVPKNLPHAELAERALLLGIAETHLKAFDEARASFGESAAYAMSVQSPALFADLEYHQALLSFVSGDLPEFALRARALIDTRDRAEHDDDYIVPLSHSRTRAYAALEAAATHDGRRPAAVEFAHAAIAEAEKGPVVDTFMLAQAYVNLSVHARDLDLPSHAAFLEARIDTIEWSQPLQGKYFTVLTALGWCDALAGNHVGALRWFRRAASAAPEAAERIVAMLSRVSLALELDHGILAEEELQHVLEMASRIDWERGVDERRLATLMQLSQVAAPIAPREARTAFERYRTLKGSVGVTSLIRTDPRYRADEAYAEGRILRSEGNVELALVRFETAFDLWTSIGFEWRAALAATELVELGAAGRFAAYGRDYAAKRPLSWIARRIAQLSPVVAVPSERSAAL